jgi:hypothetical protein
MYESTKTKNQPTKKSMNTLKSFTVTLALLVCASLTFGQDYAFKVLVNKGKNEMKSGANWEPVKVGSSLRSPDELKVSENAYVGLIHVSGKPLELKSAGKYRVADLSAKIGTGSSVINKYTEFILSNNTPAKKNNLSATGAVHRGLEKIKVYLPPSSSYVFGDTVVVEWEKEKTISAPYVVTVSSLWGDELMRTETSENKISLNLNDANLAKENDFMVKVSSKKDRKDSEEHTLRKFSRADKDRIQSAYNELAAYTSANTALNRLVQAGFFEQNKLMADAATAYQKAIKLEPTVSMYQEQYDEFLIRNSLKTPPKK